MEDERSRWDHHALTSGRRHGRDYREHREVPGKGMEDGSLRAEEGDALREGGRGAHTGLSVLLHEAFV